MIFERPPSLESDSNEKDYHVKKRQKYDKYNWYNINFFTQLWSSRNKSDLIPTKT